MVEFRVSQEKICRAGQNTCCLPITLSFPSTLAPLSHQKGGTQQIWPLSHWIWVTLCIAEPCKTLYINVLQCHAQLLWHCLLKCHAKPLWDCTFMHCSATHSFCCNLHCSVTEISCRSHRWHCTFECNSCDSVDLSGCCHADLLWRCDVTAFRHNRFVLLENTCGWKILIYLAENWLLITNAE